ncbi:hypothetical protein A5747_13275 [Mycobacterium sp. IS-836]|uniref:hypothetical protein n=1 Tax=Mycobacterium sp. IS-836 TaxID=1834160 RepID=UPI00096CC4AB|nr:hypothetical protein [Mycobacterium sp. IS-836]OMC55361.1 hypothetical protein A5747_13275 [Mycobacterium sp. IS-836]
MADANDINNLLGGPGSPANPADTIIVYEGATQADNGFTPWKAWDLRGWVRTLVHDLLRFRAMSEGKPDGKTIKRGLYDWIVRIAYQTDQNNAILRRIAAAQKVDISDLA